MKSLSELLGQRRILFFLVYDLLDKVTNDSSSNIVRNLLANENSLRNVVCHQLFSCLI